MPAVKRASCNKSRIARFKRSARPRGGQKCSFWAKTIHYQHLCTPAAARPAQKSPYCTGTKVSSRTRPFQHGLGRQKSPRHCKIARITCPRVKNPLLGPFLQRMGRRKYKKAAAETPAAAPASFQAPAQKFARPFEHASGFAPRARKAGLRCTKRAPAPETADGHALTELAPTCRPAPRHAPGLSPAPAPADWTRARVLSAQAPVRARTHAKRRKKAAAGTPTAASASMSARNRAPVRVRSPPRPYASGPITSMPM